MSNSKVPLSDMIANKASVTDILAAGYSVDDINGALKSTVETANRTAQSALDYSAKQPPKAWADRKAWLMDGQPIHGELKEFFWPACIALANDDQAEFSKQRDLLFKAIHNFLGDPPATPAQGA